MWENYWNYFKLFLWKCGKLWINKKCTSSWEKFVKIFEQISKILLKILKVIKKIFKVLENFNKFPAIEAHC